MAKTNKLQEVSLPSSAYRLGDSSRYMMIDMLICFSALVGIAIFNFGFRALILTAISVFFAITFEVAAHILMKKRITITLAPIVTGMMIALLLPVAAPYYLPVFGAGFAILICKIPFGGTGSNIFNPAAVAWVFMALIAPFRAVRYSHPGFEGLGLGITSDFAPANSLLQSLRLGITPNASFLEIFFGQTPNVMGAGAVFILLAILAYLLVRKAISPLIIATYLSSIAVIAFIFPRLDSRLSSAYYEIFTGIILFVAIFMLTDPASSPKTNLARVLYAVIAAVFTMAIRYHGMFYEGAIIAVVLVNALAKPLDRLCANITIIMQQRKEGKNA